jgi:signal transduction histidine kinase
LALVLNVGNCNAALYNLEKGTAVVSYEYTTSVASSQGRMLQMASMPELYTQLLQGQCFQFCSLTSNPVQERVVMLACPIFDDRGVLGDLWLTHRSDYAFSRQEIRLVRQVANQCAIAMRQARLYQASLAQVEALEKLNQLKDDFLSTVSHELRTPVSNMKMSIRMLEIALSQQRSLSSNDSRTARYLQILHSECEREIFLIDDLLDLQRLEAGVRPLNVESIELQTWLPQILKPFESRIQTNAQLLEVNIPAELPYLLSDVPSLERILAELLTNACKYTPPGGKILVVATAEEEKVQLRVINSGVEIPEQELPRIFDKFYRVPSGDRWKQGGTGLGLTLIKKLTEHLGGKICVESSSGQTCFTLELESCQRT